MSDTYECVVIGGGPAGLMAAIYLARFRRTVMLFDAGSGRAATIPRSHNVPSFVDGLSGQGLLDRMFEQTRLLNVPVRSKKVVSLMKTPEVFRIASEGAAVEARSVVMATGIVDRSPILADGAKPSAIICWASARSAMLSKRGISVSPLSRGM